MISCLFFLVNLQTFSEFVYWLIHSFFRLSYFIYLSSLWLLSKPSVVCLFVFSGVYYAGCYLSFLVF